MTSGPFESIMFQPLWQHHHWWHLTTNSPNSRSQLIQIEITDSAMQESEKEIPKISITSGLLFTRKDVLHKVIGKCNIVCQFNWMCSCYEKDWLLLTVYKTWDESRSWLFKVTKKTSSDMRWCDSHGDIFLASIPSAGGGFEQVLWGECHLVKDNSMVPKTACLKRGPGQPQQHNSWFLRLAVVVPCISLPLAMQKSTVEATRISGIGWRAGREAVGDCSHPSQTWPLFYYETKSWESGKGNLGRDDKAAAGSSAAEKPCPSIPTKPL